MNYLLLIVSLLFISLQAQDSYDYETDELSFDNPFFEGIWYPQIVSKTFQSDFERGSVVVEYELDGKHKFFLFSRPNGKPKRWAYGKIEQSPSNLSLYFGTLKDSNFPSLPSFKFRLIDSDFKDYAIVSMTYSLFGFSISIFAILTKSHIISSNEFDTYLDLLEESSNKPENHFVQVLHDERSIEEVAIPSLDFS